MTQITIKIELSGLDKAMTEVKAIEAYILKLAETYPTKFAETAVEVLKEEVKPKRTRKAPVKKAEVEPEPAKETKPEPEPAKETKEVKAIDLKSLTTIAKGAVGKVGREAVKELVESFSETAKLSGVAEDKREALAVALKAL